MLNEDKQLLKRLRQSDQDAFKKLFHKYYPILYRFVYYRTNDSSLSEDIIQETFLRVWKRRENLKPDKSFFSLITKIGNRIYLDELKRRNVRDRNKDTIPVPTPSHFDNPVTSHNLEILRKEIQKTVNEHLPDKCKTLFILSRYEGKSNQEIADLMNITKKTVENQLYKALKILRKKLSHLL